MASRMTCISQRKQRVISVCLSSQMKWQAFSPATLTSRSIKLMGSALTGFARTHAALFLSLLGGTLGVVVTPAIATPVDALSSSPSITDNSLPAIADGLNDELSQVTTVSQLSDVQPTDWAYTALRSLVERYGAIAGYPDGTFQGSRALTRYEFAAGLNAILDRINEQLNDSAGSVLRREDLEVIQRLQAEFAGELAALRGRVDALEARTAELESHQFSTTTQLNAYTIFTVNGGTQAGVDDPNIVFTSAVGLYLSTSFNGNDLLITHFVVGNDSFNDAAGFLLRESGAFRDDLVEAGNEITDRALRQRGLSLDNFPTLRLSNQDSIEEIQDALAANLQGLARDAGASPSETQAVFDGVTAAVGTAQGINGFLQINSALEYYGSEDLLELSQLSYTFSPSSNISVSLFAQDYASSYVDFNRYANSSFRDFSTYGFINNQLLLGNDPGGAGAAVSWNPGAGALTLRAVYRADAPAIATRPANVGNQGGLFGDPYLGIVEVSYEPSPRFGISLQYSGGAQGDDEYNVLGANLQLGLGETVGLFGRFGYAYNFPGEIQPSSWSAGVTIADLLTPGGLAGIGVGQPLIFQEDVINVFNRTQTSFEAFYRLPLNDNISITPVMQVITNPGNRDESTIWTGTLKTTFLF